MADGTTLRSALAMNRLTLSANEMRALYRNKTFKGLYQEARRRYLIENWGRKGPSLRAILGRCVWNLPCGGELLVGGSAIYARNFARSRVWLIS
jgi:hypothetical protein